MKVREIIKRIEADGWHYVSTRGSHRKFHHPTKPGHVIVHGKPSDEMATGTLREIFKQAGLR